MKTIFITLLFIVNTTLLFSQDFIETKKLTDLNGSAGDQYGYEVAISNNYAVVGSGGYSKNNPVVHVYKKNEGGINNWGLIKELSAEGITAQDEFGWAVSIDGDFIAVGAHKDEITENEQGVVYIFYKNEGGTDNWGQVAKISADDATAEANFGFSIEINENLLIVSADTELLNGDPKGTAYIFEKTTEEPGSWQQIKKLYPSNIDEILNFGYEVTISGDYAVVSSPFTAIGGEILVGSAYLYYRHEGGDNNWGEVKEIIQPDAAPQDLFAFRCDINGENLIIGAFGNNENGINAGAAYIYNKNFGGDNNWGMAYKIIPNDIAEYNGVGSSVCITDNYAIVGAFSTVNNNINSGSTYIYQNNGTPDNWSEIQEIIPSDEGNGFKFGMSVAFDGTDIIISAYKDNENGEGSGSAYIYAKETKVLNWDSNSFVESETNDGSFETTINLTLTNESFTTSNGEITNYTSNNIPEGLSIEIIAKNSYTATINLVGNATNHQNIDDIENLEITFTNEAFTSGNAQDVTNYSQTNLNIDFIDNVSINSIENKIHIYPNPSTGTFTISNKQLQITNIQITDITGKIIQKPELPINNFQFSINKKGTYFITIQTENQIYTEKIIIL